MKPDRIADIPVRHRFVDYLCTMGYSAHKQSFTLVGARFADPRRTEKPKNGTVLYLRILREPALRANLLQALVPDDKEQITDLREKAIAERGKNYGSTVGLAAFALAGYSLYRLTLWLSTYVGYNWAEIITYIPAFFAFLIIFPVQEAVERWYARRYCKEHGHRLDSFKYAHGKDVTWCKRCGLNVSLPTHAGEA